MNDKELLLAFKKYIEDMEFDMDQERGDCREVQELIKAGEMPELYNEVLSRLEQLK
jgi:hypothetical protein